jgi:serine/threonine protein kinase
MILTISLWERVALLGVTLLRSHTQTSSRRKILREKKEGAVKVERDILNLLDHSFIVRLFGTFQDQHSLYMCFEIAEVSVTGDLVMANTRCRFGLTHCVCFLSG